MLKRSLVFSAALATVLPAVAACSSGDSGGDSGGGDILFAASLPLTGSFSVPGEFHEQGYKLCCWTDAR
jgi:hypothetical protein